MMNAEMSEETTPLLPMKPVSKTLVSTPSTATTELVTESSSMPHMAAIMVELGLIAFPAGMRRFMEVASELAVCPATMMPKTPMV